MKQKIRFHVLYLGIFTIAINPSWAFSSSLPNKTQAQEQGEEVYQPKETDNKPAVLKTASTKKENKEDELHIQKANDKISKIKQHDSKKLDHNNSVHGKETSENNQLDTEIPSEDLGFPVESPAQIDDEPPLPPNETKKDKIKLKEFDKEKKALDKKNDKTNTQKEPSVDKSLATQENPPPKNSEKDKLTEEDTASDNETVAAKDDHSQNNEKTEEDIHVEKNKLVDADDKAIAPQKHNGIFWFIGVFIILLIVVFAFT